LTPCWKRRLGNAFLLLVSLAVFWRTVAKVEPLWNWDVLGYMALALEWELDDPVEVHRETYAAARRELEPSVFDDLTSPDVEVRAARFRDPAAFTEHIAFYRARVLPTLLMSLLHRAGAPLSSAVWWLSLASFALTGVLIIVWLAGRVPLWAALTAGTLLAHAPPLLVTARFATADGLGTLLVCVGLYFFLERRRTALGAAVLTLSVLTRPDAVILIGLLAVTLVLLDRRAPQGGRVSPKLLGVWIVASALCYLGVQAHADEYGWWPLIQISFGPKAIHPAELSTAVDLGAYGKVLAQQLEEIPGGGYWGTPRQVTGSGFVFVYAGSVVLALASLREQLLAPRLRRHVAFLVALLATYLVRWLLFPQLWDRFLAPFYVLVPLAVVSLVVLAREDEDQNASKDVTPAITSS